MIILTAAATESWLSPSTFIAIIGAIGGGGLLTALITLGPTRRKIRSESGSVDSGAAQVITSSAISLLNPMRDQINLLNAAVKLKETHIDMLEHQVRDLGGDPVDEPSELPAV